MALGAAAIMGLIGSGVQSAVGAYQAIRAASIKNDRPVRTIPPEIEQNLNQAQIQALQGMPDEQYNQTMQNFQRNLAFGARTLQDRNQAIGGVAGLVQGANDAALGLGVQDANMRRQNQQQLMGARQDMANQRMANWDWNERQKFQENAAAKSNLAGGAIANVTGAVNTGMSGFAQDNFSKMFGDNSNNYMKQMMSQGGKLTPLGAASIPFINQ
jgi:hypothetical protein